MVRSGQEWTLLYSAKTTMSISSDKYKEGLIEKIYKNILETKKKV
jgi:hypothetical protein